MPVTWTYLPLAAALTAVASTAPAAAERPLLTCQISTTSQRPLTFDPAVGFLPRNVTARATLELSGCTGPAASSPGLRAGVLTAEGTGRASCGGVKNVHGKGRITWFGADGRQAGTSILRPSVSHVQTYNPGDMLLIGRVAKGLLAGARATGTATPTSAISVCATKGLSRVYSTGKVTFLG